jgi:hypothetical protein
LQKEVDDLKEQIAEKKGEVKPLTTWNWPPMVFMKRDLADKFIDQVVMDAEKAKQKAAEKEAKESQ